MQDYQFLFASLIIANPFAITLLISSFKHIIENDSITNVGLFRSFKSKTKSHKINKTNEPRSFLCCTYQDDKIYLYFKYWLISSHFTFLITLQYYVVGSLTITGQEISLLYCCYIILLVLILNLKNYISRVTNNFSSNKLSSAMPLAVDNNIDHNNNNITQSDSSKLDTSSTYSYNCDGLCYLKMLAHPIIINDKNMDWINCTKNNLQSMEPTSLEIYSNTEADTSNVSYDSKSTTTSYLSSIITLRKMINFDQTSIFNFWPTQSSYLMLCNIFHILISAQMFYLNVTFACACNISRLFGKYLLIPVECSDVYDNLEARTAIFIGVYSGQILFSHLAFISIPLFFKTK